MLTADDRYAIRKLYAEYGWARSTADVDAFVKVFADDSVIIRDEGSTFAGPSAALEYITEWIHRPGSAGQQYWVMQQVLDPVREDECQSRAFLMTPMMNPIGTPSMAFYRFGYLTDRVVKREGRWLISEHVIEQWRGPILSGFPGGPPEAWGLSTTEEDEA